MMKPLVTRKHLGALVLGTLLMASASPAWAADNYFGNFTDSSKGAAETTGKTISGDVTYIMDETTLTPSGSEVDYTGMEVYSPNSDPVKVNVTGNYQTTITNTKGQSMGLKVGKNGIVNLGSSDANKHTFTVTGPGGEVFGIRLEGTDSNNEENKLHVTGTTNITVTHDDTKKGTRTRGISDTSSHESDTSPHNTIFEGSVSINVAGNNSSYADGIYHDGDNTLTFNDDVDITVLSNKVVVGISLSSPHADAEMKTNFNKKLTVIASGSPDYDVTGINSGGSWSTGTAEFNGDVEITSTGRGINNSNGTLNFRENADITAGKIGVKAIGPNSRTNFDKGLMVTSKDDNTITALYAENSSTINVNNIGKNGGVQIAGNIEAASGGSIMAKLTTADSFIKGDVIANGGGIATITIDGTGTFTGNSTAEDSSSTLDVSMANGATWNVTGAENILTTLNLGANSTVNLADKTMDQKITMAKLEGKGGTFVLDIDSTQDSATATNDKILVTDSFTGKANLALVDTTGSSILKKGAINTVLATTIKNSGDDKGEFSAASAETPLYWMDYELRSEDSASYGSNYTDWVIAGPAVNLSRPTTTVDTIMSSAVGSYYAWRTHNDKLMQRLGDLRQSQNEDQGIWARITRDGTEYDHNAYFHNNTSTMQLGYDKVVSRDTKDNYWVAGGAIGYINGSGSYHYGSSDNSGATLSLYGTRMGNKGHYLDLVATIGKYNNHFDSYMAGNFRQDGDYDTLGYSVSAEYGRKTPLKSGWYVEPQMQLTFGHLNSVDYVTTNKVRVDQDGINSAIGRVGFNIGRSVGQKANFYLKANLSHEFGGSGHVAMSTSNQNRNEDLSLDDTWFTYGLGVSAPVNKDSYMYFDIERSTGSDFTTDWQWNAGMRFSI